MVKTHGYFGTPTYTAWSSMHDRCRNPKNASFKHYGGRGIAVCAAWQYFEAFLADMGEKPEGLSLDRFPDVDGNYSRGNCRWATDLEQSRNRRNTVLVTFRGQTKAATEWSAELGLKRWTVTSRLKEGWSVERALTEPVNRRPTENMRRRAITHAGETMSVRAWDQRLGGNGAVNARLAKGWSVERAVTEPIKRRGF